MSDILPLLPMTSALPLMLPLRLLLPQPLSAPNVCKDARTPNPAVRAAPRLSVSLGPHSHGKHVQGPETGDHAPVALSPSPPCVPAIEARLALPPGPVSLPLPGSALCVKPANGPFAPLASVAEVRSGPPFAVRALHRWWCCCQRTCSCRPRRWSSP